MKKIFAIIILSVLSVGYMGNHIVYAEESDYEVYEKRQKPADKKLLQAVELRDFDYMVEAIKEGANVNTTNYSGNTPLIIASGYGLKDIAEYLLKNKANVNVANNNFGQTALMVASTRGDVEIVKLLIAHKADVNLRTSLGTSACDYAKRNEHTEIIEILKAAGAK